MFFSFRIHFLESRVLRVVLVVPRPASLSVSSAILPVPSTCRSCLDCGIASRSCATGVTGVCSSQAEYASKISSQRPVVEAGVLLSWLRPLSAYIVYDSDVFMMLYEHFVAIP